MPEHAFSKFVELPGSQRKPVHNAKVTEAITPGETFEVTVRVRRRKPLPALGPHSVRMTRAAYSAAHGADPADTAKVEEFAKHFHLKVEVVLSAERSVLLSGTAANFSKAFQVELKRHDLPDGKSYRGRSGKISIPSELQDIVTGVFGLDNRRVAWPQVHYKMRAAAQHNAAGFQTNSPTQAFFPNELAKLYDFPTGVDGSGQTIGIVELGGGFEQKDLDAYCKKAGLKKAPQISVAKVTGGATNKPDPKAQDQPDVEVLLDMEVIATVAPGAEMVMYFVKDGSDQQCLRGVTAAVHDEKTNISILSLSWGGPEFEPSEKNEPGASMTKQFQDNLNEVLEAAAHLGITVCVASGDNASACVPVDDPQRPWDGKAHVSFPASSPWVLACGGTHIVKAAAKELEEECWHPEKNIGTGGGISRYFAMPDYQKGIVKHPAVNPKGGEGRGVPDIAGDAAQESGYHVLVDGQWFPDDKANRPPIGGTSAVAPLWAGLIALLNESLKTKLGFMNPALYKLHTSHSIYHDVTKGNNGDYTAAKGWDPCTGLGTPDGQALLKALGSAAAKNVS